MFKTIKRQIVELFFQAELDEDYWLGIHHGKEVALSTAILRIGVGANNSTKTYKAGMKKAQELIKELQNGKD